jgi:predicted molibdopterin-dependent oxidoreductase YjgC
MPRPKELLTATIDGRAVTVLEGTLVVEAARLHGIDAPTGMAALIGAIAIVPGDVDH